MAALTWRNIEIPQFDTRGLQVAGAGVADAFNRMGQMLHQKEATLRDEATNAAIAQGLATQDPEAVKALLAKGPAGLGRRVDTRAFMEALGAHQNQLIERGMNQEQLEALQDPKKFGAMYAQLQAAAQEAEVTGDYAARDALVAQMQGARNIAEHLRQGTMLGNTDQDQGMTLARDKVDANYKAGSLANQSRQIALAEEDQTWARQDRTQAKSREAAEREGAEWGRRYVEALPGQFTGSAKELLMRTPQYQAASPEARRGMLAGTEGRKSEVLVDTPWNTSSQSAIAANNEAARAQSSGQVAQTLVMEQLAQNNPGLAILRRAEAPEYQNVTIDQVIERYKQTGIMDPATFIERAQARGIPLSRLMAAPDVVDMKDRSWTPDKLVTSMLQGGILTGFGAPGESEMGSNVFGFDFRSGTTRANAGLFGESGVKALQDPGSLAAAQQALDGQLAPINALQTRLAQLNAQATAERQKNNGKVSPETLLSIRLLRQQMEELVSARRPE